ncbi:MAG: hypothetical protein HZB23_00035 [Deltaproteobacteria bacterium]|nr:hypothetical protein [Deltaproteobacteria bacterium]
MEAVFFPHTYVSDDAARFFSALFGPVTVFLPTDLDVPGRSRLEGLAEEKALALAFPLKEITDRAALASALRDAHSAVNRGLTSDAALAMALSGRTPFYDDTHPGAIRDQVRADGAVKQEPDHSTELFLHSAQSLDSAQYEAALALLAVRLKEAALFRKLNGEDEKGDPASFVDVPPQAAWHRVDRRMKFFGRMLLASGVSPQFLVTRSREAVDILRDVHGDSIIHDGEMDVSIPPTANELRAVRGMAEGLLKKGAEGRAPLPVPAFGRPPLDERTIKMRLSFDVAEMNAAALFAPLAGKPAPADASGRTVICLASGPDL